MKLRGLEAHLMKHEWRNEQTPGVAHSTQPPYLGWRYVETLAEADGLTFLCPVCFAANNGPVGTHSVMIPFSNAPPGSYLMKNKQGQEPRWSASGHTIDDLVLTPSIQIFADCNWHGFVGSNGVPPGEAL